MRIKICGMRTADDIKALLAAGADSAGFLIGQLHASADFILPSTASRLLSLLPPYIYPVLVTHLKNADEIQELVLKTGINCVQLHGDSPLKEVQKLRDILPINSKIIFSVYVQKPDSLLSVRNYYSLINAVLLDAFNRGPGLAGSSEKTDLRKNWETAADFARQCPLPLTLAGGLTPENVAEAVKIVKPFAVDANTSLKGDAGDAHSMEKCTAFVKNARAAAEN